MRDALALARRTFEKWQEDRGAMLAASLAYYTVFSLAPLLIVVIGTISVVLGRADVQAAVIRQLRDILGMDAARFVASLIRQQSATRDGVWASLLGTGLMILGASGVFVQLQNALNAIWGVRPASQRGGLRALVLRRLLAFAAVLLIGLLLLVSLLLPAALALLERILPSGFPGSEFLWQAVAFALSLGVTTLLFAFMFRFLPDARVAWRDVWVGAAVTALLFTLGKTLLGLYLGRGAVASAYGAAGSLVLILVFVYYSAQIILLGAEFTQVYARWRSGDPAPGAGAKPEFP